jgi:hypothetical protein
MAGGRRLPPSLERLWLGELRRAHAILNMMTIICLSALLETIMLTLTLTLTLLMTNRSVGELLTTLDRLGIADDTWVRSPLFIIIHNNDEGMLWGLLRELPHS